VTEPSELEFRSSTSLSHFIFDQELRSTRATSADEDENEGNVFMEVSRLLENQNLLRMASKIGLRLLKANDFETELSVCLKSHSENLKAKSRTEEQKAIAYYMEFHSHSLARTLTRKVFEDLSKPLQLLQSFGQDSESASEKMNRFYQAFISVNPEEFVLSDISRSQENPSEEMVIDIKTITRNEESFLSNEAFSILLVKLENMVQKETWIDLTSVLIPILILQTAACSLLAKTNDLYIALSNQLGILCRPRVRPGYCRLNWKCVCLLAFTCVPRLYTIH
jgi:hypothetical protein